MMNFRRKDNSRHHHHCHKLSSVEDGWNKHTWSHRCMMLPMSCSDTSVPMEISAASLTSPSISSGRISDRSVLDTFVRSPENQKHIFENFFLKKGTFHWFYRSSLVPLSHRRRKMMRQWCFTDFADSFAVGQVVCDDFSQFGKVPAVPFSAAHNVVVELLIQVVQKSWDGKEKN